ncbi:MAG: hypothetical protein ACSW72_04040 [Bacteroidales bacterium]
MRTVEEVYEQLKAQRKWSAGEDLNVLRRLLDRFGQFRAIKQRIAQSTLKQTLWWPCVRLEEFMWEDIRRHLNEKGYDPAWIWEKDGLFGLEGYTYNDGLPCEYEEILITFDGLERMENPIPVRKNSRCGLVKPDGIGTPVSPFQYDLLFRKPYSEYVKYIAILDGKYGVLLPDGSEVVPCQMDCIYDSLDTHGLLPILRGGKWGFMEEAGGFVEPKFDELMIRSEQYLRVRINDQWGWVDGDDQFTLDIDQACYGSWAD